MGQAKQSLSTLSTGMVHPTDGQIADQSTSSYTFFFAFDLRMYNERRAVFYYNWEHRGSASVMCPYISMGLFFNFFFLIWLLRSDSLYNILEFFFNDLVAFLCWHEIFLLSRAGDNNVCDTLIL